MATESGADPVESRGNKARAATMATYLRSAIGRASERLAPAAPAPSKLTTKQEEDPTSESNQADEEQDPSFHCSSGALSVDSATTKNAPEDEEEEKGDLEERALGIMSDKTDDKQQEEEDGERFLVHLDPLTSPYLPRPSHHTVESDWTWAFRDVLVQPDAHGIGLNVCEACPPERFPSQILHDCETVVTVASFRRLNPADIGPAEACKQIQIGDVLCSVDGNSVSTLAGVARAFQRKENSSQASRDGSYPFVLLRFLRPVSTKSVVVDTTQPVISDSSSTTSATTDITTTTGIHFPDHPEISILIRELVVKNQHLQEQLLASRLKQDDQRIQLEQLHALYAKTQLDNGPSLLPFAKQAPAFNRRSLSSSSASSNTPKLSSAASRLLGNSSNVSPVAEEIGFAVQAERERLTRHYEQKMETESKDLQIHHALQIETMEATMAKKIRMLEYALQQLMSVAVAVAPTADTDGSRTAAGAGAGVLPPYVQTLRHQLLHQQTLDHNCVLCLLTTHWPQTQDSETTTHWRERIMEILDEYYTSTTVPRPENMMTNWSESTTTTDNTHTENSTHILK